MAHHNAQRKVRLTHHNAQRKVRLTEEQVKQLEAYLARRAHYSRSSAELPDDVERVMKMRIEASTRHTLVKPTVKKNKEFVPGYDYASEALRVFGEGQA